MNESNIIIKAVAYLMISIAIVVLLIQVPNAFYVIVLPMILFTIIGSFSLYWRK